MLLSIVECSSKLTIETENTSRPPARFVNDKTEWIGPVLGPSAAVMRNRGARVATGRWLFFKDPDCKIDVFEIEKLCTHLELKEREIKVVGGVYKNQSQTLLGRVYNFIQRSWVFGGLERDKVGFFYPATKLLGGALLVEAEAFERIGGFSAEIGWGGEELEFINRFRKKKELTVLSYRLKSIHKNDLNLLGFAKRAWWQNYNPGYYNFSRNNPIRSGFGYFRSPVNYWPALCLFLGIGVLANLSGVLARRWGGLWN